MMELTFSHTNMNCYQLIHQCVHVQEETQEAIVPDACPDILRVVESCGRVCLRGTQAHDGSASASGVMIATILYLPEGESGLRRMEITIPFDCSVSVPELSAKGTVIAKTRLRGIDTRVLNPRKVLVRAEVAVELSAYMEDEVKVCDGVETNGAVGLQQYHMDENAYIISAVQVKPFSFTETIRLGGQGETAEVMTVRARPNCTEHKQIGGKLVLKGEVLVQLLVREPAGGLVVSEHPLPFSQIMEIPHAEESSDCTISLEIIQLNLQSDGDGGKQLDVQVELLAQALVCSHKTIMRLEDAYSTGWEMDTTRENHTLMTFLDASSNTQNMREILEVNGTVRKVMDSWCTSSEVTQRREGLRMQLCSDLHIWVLYLDDGGSLQCHNQIVRVETSVDCPENVNCRCDCRCIQEVYATPTAGGVEARCSVEFEYVMLKEKCVTSIAGGTLSAPRKRGMAAPSVVLRRGEMGETLWDLAKFYGTTTAEIRMANELDEGVDVPSGMLLIPSVRDVS